MSAINNPLNVCLPLEDLRRLNRAIARLYDEAERHGVSRETLDVAKGWLEENWDAIYKAEAIEAARRSS